MNAHENKTPVLKVDILRDILTWSADRPLWQRDALRRLVTQGALNDLDVAELAEFCKTSHGLANTATSQPLAASHLPQPGVGATPVSLIALTHHSGVNALAPDQTIDFGPALTVVYGANAAGKSGYTRILKRACRARGAEDILGNVVSGSAPGRPAATITYKLDGADQPPHRWDDADPPHRDLSRVSVFDRHCASVYISEQTDVAYRPLGLDLFDRLADACEAVRRILERERKEPETRALHLPEVGQGTKAHDLLSRLTSLTNPESVKQLASLSEAEVGQLEELRKRLRDLRSEDPQKTARAIELRANRVEGLGRKLQAINSLLSDEAVQRVFAARDRLKEARKAAEEMRRATFEQQPLSNTGSDAWRLLWAAAERFSSTDAYPDDAFPVTEADARCVLCQQHLKEDGIKRLRRFYDFLTSQVQRDRDDAAALYERLSKELRDLVVLDETTHEVLDELQLEDSNVVDAARAYLDTAKHRRSALINILAKESSSASVLPSFSSAPVSVTEHVQSLRTRASELRGADRSEAITRLEAELRELEARHLLGKHIDAVLTEIERKKRVAAYQVCLEETTTTAITRKSTELTKRAVSDKLASSFKTELDMLAFRHVEVEMVAAGGVRGSLYHKLQLRRAPGVPVPSVVSEGEARCLSIASFFAELSTAEDRSTILFDDPVSSLDHNWRDAVAARLVEESKSRQVIVFTHDIVFLVSLVDHAEQSGTDVKHQSLRRGYTATGLSDQGPPYQGMKVNARIGYLKDRLQVASKLYRENKPQEYEEAGKHIYGHLRQAWERAVEEVLLNEVVLRYRKSVETQRAKYLGDITEDDCKGLTDGMTKCSKWEGGHDHAGAEGARFPDPSEIEQDIKALVDWANTIRKRRSK